MNKRERDREKTASCRFFDPLSLFSAILYRTTKRGRYRLM